MLITGQENTDLPLVRRLRVELRLIDGWVDCTPEHPGGFQSYRRAEKPAGVLQVSMILHVEGAWPNPDELELADMSRAFGRTRGWGEPAEIKTGLRPFGKMGTALFSCKEFPHARAWHISDGRDIIVVTYFNASITEPDELSEAVAMAEAAILSPERRVWSFWR